MRFKNGVYFFVNHSGEWKPLGRDLSKALEAYLKLYGCRCTAEIRDTVTDLYLSTM